jgi:L-aspartate oxidase
VLDHLDLPSLACLDTKISALRELCWQVAGVERSPHALAPALQQVRRQRQELETSPAWRQLQALKPGPALPLPAAAVPALKRLQEWHQRLVLASLLMEAALFRQESRGGHHRTDAPAAQPFWQRHTDQRRDLPLSTARVLV